MAAVAKPVRCPICRRSISPAEAGAFGPFCSARCRAIDLGGWLDGRYRIPAPPDDESDGQPKPSPIENEGED